MILFTPQTAFTMGTRPTASSIVEVIRHNAAQNADTRIFTFLCDGETETITLTYAEIDAQACAVAGHLQTLAAPGERAILIYPPGLENITAMLACFYAAVVFVPTLPVPLDRAPETLLGVVADTHATLVLTTAELRPRLQTLFEQFPALRSLNLVATDAVAQTHPADEWHPPTLAPDTLAALLYTSGSTRAARGIAIRHGRIIQTMQRMRHGTNPDVPGCRVTWNPLYHGSGMGDIFLYPLVGRAPIIILPTTAFLERPARWLQAITRYRAVNSGGPNFGYRMCVEQISPDDRAALDLSSWRVASVGNEPIHAKTLEAFATAFAPYGFRREAFFLTYGVTEGTMVVSSIAGFKTSAFDRAALEQGQVIPAAPEAVNTLEIVCCGHPTPGSSVRIVEPASLTPVPPDRVGEIWVSSEFAFEGYWNKPEETELTFGAHLAGSGEGPFLRTGDMGFLYKGELYVAGRLKDMIILRGRNYYAQDVERAAVLGHPALQGGGSAAFSIPQDGEEQLVIVHEIHSNGAAVDVDAIARGIRSAVAGELHLPVQQVVLVKAGSLPRTATGKIQRHLTREQFLASADGGRAT